MSRHDRLSRLKAQRDRAAASVDRVQFRRVQHFDYDRGRAIDVTARWCDDQRATVTLLDSLIERVRES